MERWSCENQSPTPLRNTWQVILFLHRLQPSAHNQKPQHEEHLHELDGTHPPWAESCTVPCARHCRIDSRWTPAVGLNRSKAYEQASPWLDETASAAWLCGTSSETVIGTIEFPVRVDNKRTNSLIPSKNSLLIFLPSQPASPVGSCRHR